MTSSSAKFTCAIAAALVFSVAQTSAVIIAWDVTGHGSPADTTLAASTVDPNLDTTDGFDTLSRVGLGGSAAANSFSSTTWNNTSTFNAANKYITFTINPLAGYQLNLTDLRAAMNGSPTAPNNGRWGYSLDGGTTFTYESDYATPTAAQSTLNNVFDFTDFSTTSTVVFRFWEWGAVSISGGAANAQGTTRIANISGNDLVLNGTVTQIIPEPSTIGLIGLGLVGLVAFARRRHA